MGKAEFYTLISAGDNWYETQGMCEVIPVSYTHLMYEAALLFLQNFRLYRVDGCVEFLYTAYEKEWG